MGRLYHPRVTKTLAGLAVLLFVAAAAVWYVVYVETSRHELTVAVLDIGQGDSIFIEAPNGNQVLVDAGPNSKVLSELGKVMPWYDKSIDMIVITNPDKDHIAGFIDVLKRFKVDYELEPNTKNKTATNVLLHELIDEKGLKKLDARRGMKITLDREAGVTLTVLFPDRDVSGETSNDGSIVMRLKYGDTEVMLTGDATQKVEREILAHGTSTDPTTALSADPNVGDLALDSDILKVGHHGSKTSTSEEFVRAVNPEFAAISCGVGNKYGHPNQETLDTLAKFPIQVLRTDKMSTIIFKSDGRNFRLVN